MALSRLQKGMIGLGAAVIAVIIVGYAGMRYLENAVVETIRTWAAQTPPNARVEVGDVTYKLMEGHLAVKDVRFAYKEGDETVATLAIAQVDVLQPGETFFAVLRDPQTEVKEARLTIAGSVRARGISMGLAPAVTIDERVISGIQVDTAALKAFLASRGTQDLPRTALGLAYGLSYESDVSKGIHASVKALPYTVTIKESRQIGYAEGHLRSSVITGLSFKKNDSELGSIAEVTAENMNLPPQHLLLKLFDPEWQKKTPEDEQVLEAIRVFGGPKPLLGSLVVRDLRDNTGLATVSLGKMTYVNSSTSPFTVDLALEHFKIPTTFAPELQALSLMDLRDLDVSATLSFSLPAADGAFSVSSSLNVAELGTADALFKGTLPQEVLKEAALIGARSDLPGAEMESNVLIQENIRFSQLELGYADEGLLPRLGLLSQKLMGLTPEQSLIMVKQYIQQAIGFAADDPDMARIDSFIEKPGAIRLILSPEKPLSLEEIENLPKDTPAIRLDATPGPKTLQELLTALEQ